MGNFILMNIAIENLKYLQLNMIFSLRDLAAMLVSLDATPTWRHKRSLISSYLKLLLTKTSAEIYGFGCSFGL